MVRNFHILNRRPFWPTRSCRKKMKPGESILISAARSRNKGEPSANSTDESATSQNRLNTAASVPGAVNQNLLYTVPLRMQLSNQQIHQIFLDEQKQGNQAQSDNQQPPREQKAGEKADGEGNQKCLGGDTYHLLGFANS